MEITYALIKQLGACWSEYTWMRKMWASSVEVTEHNTNELADLIGPHWQWVVYHLLPTRVAQAWEDAVESARFEYFKGSLSHYDLYKWYAREFWKLYCLNQGYANAIATLVLACDSDDPSFCCCECEGLIARKLEFKWSIPQGGWEKLPGVLPEKPENK